MFTVHIVTRVASRAMTQAGIIPESHAVAAKQAGGCTVAELPRENALVARAEAARRWGGTTSNWQVERHVGTWESREAAEIIAQAEEAELPCPLANLRLLSQIAERFKTDSGSAARHLDHEDEELQARRAACIDAAIAEIEALRMADLRGPVVPRADTVTLGDLANLVRHTTLDDDARLLSTALQMAVAELHQRRAMMGDPAPRMVHSQVPAGPDLPLTMMDHRLAEEVSRVSPAGAANPRYAALCMLAEEGWGDLSQQSNRALLARLVELPTGSKPEWRRCALEEARRAKLPAAAGDDEADAALTP